MVHRFAEMSNFLMLQHHGHTLDFSSGPRFPYQPCVGQCTPLAPGDPSNAAATAPSAPTCRLIGPLPCQGFSGAPFVANTCQPFTMPSFGNPPATQNSTATTASVQMPNQGTFVEPRSPPPPTRKVLEEARKRNGDPVTEPAVRAKYARTDPTGEIQFRPWAPSATRRPFHLSRLTPGGRLAKSSSSKSPANPYKFEFNIPFPPKQPKFPLRPRERAGKRSHSNLPQAQALATTPGFPTMWAPQVQAAPKQGYISVLEQAINQLSEGCAGDARNPATNKENVQDSTLSNLNLTATKESLDQAWLTVLDKVFGKSDPNQAPRSRNSFSYTSSGSGYPSESYSEVDWTTSTLESDCVSGAEQEVTTTKTVSKAADSNTEAQVVPSVDREAQLTPSQSSEPGWKRELSERSSTPSAPAVPEAKVDRLSEKQDVTSKPEVVLEDALEDGMKTEQLDCEEQQGSTEAQTQNDDFEYSDEEDVRDEREEEKATDADVETEFMSSAEHERPKWSLHKPRLLNLKRSVAKAAPVVYRPPTTDGGGNEGFVTPTYRCNFPTSSDSEATQGNGTPSQARKPQPPFKSPGPVDPKFRGVTMQIRTKVEENQVQLSVKGFFK